MPSKTFGGLVWTDQPAEDYISTTRSLATLGALAGAGLLGGYYLTKPLASGARPIDYVAATARVVGNASPMQLLNTFRVPEFLSPYTSLQYKRGSGAPREGVTSWGRDFLKSESSYDWIKYSTGLDDAELQARGLTRGMPSSRPDLADALVYEPHAGRTTGDLMTVRGGSFNAQTGLWEGGQRTLLSSDISLMAMSSEAANPLLLDKGGLNRAAVSVMDAADMRSRAVSSGRRFNPSQVLTRQVPLPAGGTQFERAAFMPVPSTYGRLANLEDLGRRTNAARATLAFGMDRFNRLLTGVTEAALGPAGVKAMQAITGFGPGVKPGPASAQFARFGMRAAGAGAIYMGVQQVDWMRRNYSMPGEIAASGLVSAGLSYGLSKMGMGGRHAMMAGVASFFGQMVMPGFDQGVVQGLSTTKVNLDIMRANALNPFNYLRRTLEGFAPGITDFETGALASVGVLAASYLNLPKGRGSVAQEMLRAGFGAQTGFQSFTPSDKRQLGRFEGGVRREFWRVVGDDRSLRLGGLAPQTLGEKFDAWDRVRQRYGGTLGGLRQLGAYFGKAEENLRNIENPMNKQLELRMRQIAHKYSGGTLFDSLQRNVRGFAAQAYYSFFGANLGMDKAMSERIQNLGFGAIRSAGGNFRIPVPTARMGRFGTLGLAAFALHGLVTGGLLGSKETAQDLREIYSGRKLVPVRESRFWEAGGTPFEGAETEYFRPHQYHLMMNRVREVGIWGAGEDEISPIKKFLLKNFTYELEKRQYYDRPYPISSAAFSDVPIIGGVLSSTIGQFIKPARLMHVDEWVRMGESGNLEYASVHRGDRIEPAYELGAHRGIPTSPFSPGSQAAFLSYQFRELEGMTGWAKNLVQSMTTGQTGFGGDSLSLAEAGQMSSYRMRFWEASTGGALFTNEFLRRILPAAEGRLESTNPIANAMPSWLPDKLRYGDPYRIMQWGEARLPGPGYAALHPELRGVDPEGYPLIHRYAILADVAPFSREFAFAKEQVYTRRAEGYMSQKEIDYLEAIDERHRRQTAGYQDDRIHERAVRLPGSSLTRGAYALAQSGLRSIAAPGEYLVPMGFRPLQKLMHDRTAIQQYEYERLYGTPLAFWDKPMRDWLRPSAYSALNMMGWDGKPAHRQSADNINEYFDKLEFIKYMSLAAQANAMGDHRAEQSFRYRAGTTRHGVNPQGSPMGIYWSLPASERKFFNAFAHAQGKERDRIVEMVPEDQVHLYQALWSRVDAGESVWPGAPASTDDRYLAQQMIAADQYMEGLPMPSPDWIGFNEHVDMDDIRVRYLDRSGAELADYGMWEKQLKKSMQQPFLEGSIDPFPGVGAMNAAMAMRQLTGVPAGRGSWQMFESPGMMSSVSIGYDDNRDADIRSKLQDYLNGF